MSALRENFALSLGLSKGPTLPKPEVPSSVFLNSLLHGRLTPRLSSAL